MARVVWTSRASDELEAVCDYIGLDSDRYARLIAEQIVAATERIGEFPEAGSIVPEFQNPDIRERLVHRYRIIYQHRMSENEATTKILAIIHGSRRLTDI